VLQFFFARGIDSFLGLTLTVVPASIVLALVTYKLIEEPFLRLRRRWSPSAPKQDQDAAAAPAAATSGAG
jgi:peptidoglycan/LPS O-acetylase OafA/YrhL